jgi:hypothetical protein
MDSPSTTQRRRGNAPARVDQFARRIHDQIVASAALDDDRQAAAMLRQLADYLSTKELEVRQTAWDADRAAPTPTITARYDGQCAECGEAIRVGDAIVYEQQTRRATHSHCGGAAC